MRLRTAVSSIRYSMAAQGVTEVFRNPDALNDYFAAVLDGGVVEKAFTIRN